MAEQESVISILTEALSFNEGQKKLSPSDPLMGAIPEFDSMTVVSVLTKLEDHYGFIIDDDEIDAEVFETVKSLIDFVEQKLSYCA